MSRSMQEVRETEADTAETATGAQETTESGGRLAGVKRRAARVFSPRSFLLSLLVVVVGIAAGGFLGGLIPFLGTVGQFVGVFAATFVLGVVRARRHYLEVAAAGAVAATLVVLASTLNGAFLPVGVEVLQQYGLALAGIGAGTGAAAALLGYYFGRDLRAGLTKSV
jgi:hypothetical protein